MLAFWFPNLKTRAIDPELMDNAQSDTQKLLKTLSQFKLLNFLFSRSRSLLKKIVLPEIKKNPDRPYTFLDLGAGGCDLPIWLIKKSRKLGIKLQITCLEIDSRIIHFAAQKIKNYPEITLLHHSALEIENLPDPDFIFANHLLHHLDDNAIKRILPLCLSKSRINFILNDIYRSRAAYLGYTVFTGLFLRRSFAFADGRLSIAKGFREKELEQLTAPLQDIRILRLSPARIALTRPRE